MKPGLVAPPAGFAAGRLLDRFASKLTKAVPPAVILGGDSTNGLAFVRSLGRRGVPVLSIASQAGPELRTRYGTSVIQPCEDGAAAALLELMLGLGSKLPVRGAIIACADAYVSFLSRNREALADYYDFNLPDAQTIDDLSNKAAQYQLAEARGFAIPRTLEVGNDLGRIAGSITYPCVLKPVNPDAWKAYQRTAGARDLVKLLTVESRTELLARGRLIADSKQKWLVQELIEGGDDQLYALYAHFDRDSKPLATFVRRKLRQWPKYGDGCYSEGVRDDEVLEVAVGLLQSLGYRGLTNTEFKRDPRDGKLKLIEVNVRCAAQTSLALASGVDLPYVAYRDIIGEPIAQDSAYRPGVRWLNLTGDCRAFLELRTRGEIGLLAWLKSLIVVRSHAYFAGDDLMPVLSLGMTLATRLMSRTLRRPGRWLRPSDQRQTAGG